MSYQIVGPPVGAIGWIPYYALPQDIPKKSPYGQRLPLTFLLDSGNREPPGSFSGAHDLLEFYRRCDLRAMLFLYDVLATCADSGAVLDLKARPFGEVGYTPFRTVDVTSGRKFTFTFSGGDGSAHTNAYLSGNFGVIRTIVRFKLGKIGNFFNFILTGALAPSAWMAIEYRINSDATTIVTFSASHIPSQYYYANWHTVGAHDMLGISTRAN